MDSLKNFIIINQIDIFCRRVHSWRFHAIFRVIILWYCLHFLLIKAFETVFSSACLFHCFSFNPISSSIFCIIFSKFIKSNQISFKYCPWQHVPSVPRLFDMFCIETSYWTDRSDNSRRQKKLLRIAYNASYSSWNFFRILWQNSVSMRGRFNGHVERIIEGRYLVGSTYSNV